MDHLLKELLDEMKEQNDEILDDLSLIKEKLGINSEENLDLDEKEEEF